MSRYMAIFHIGPVQEFIQSAKKTADYWSGSFLLSYFCATAIHKIGMGRVIFPAASGNELYKQVVLQKGMIPWQNAGVIPESAYMPSLPNRLFSQFDEKEDPGTELKKAKEVIETQWQSIQKAVYDELCNKGHSDIEKSSIWKAIWDRQVKNPFEILYVWRKSDYPVSETYPSAYRSTETLMGSRKASRWFGPEEGERGHKCTLCGVREALYLSMDKEGAAFPPRSEIRKQWESTIRQRKLKYKFREGETLCAICVIKRLAPEYVFGKDIDVPSTTTIAVAATVRDLIEYKKSGKFPAAELKALQGKVQDTAKRISEPEVGSPVPKNKVDPALLNIDGDWFYRDFYQKMKQRHKNNPSILNELNSTEDKLLAVLKRLEAIKEKEMNGNPYLSPCKYYAVLAADGDDMGKILGSVQNDIEHRKLSDKMAEFSVTHANEVLQEKALGYVVYFGGDEGVTFMALEDLIEVMKKLRNIWTDKVVKPLQNSGIKAPTLSVGVTIAHHQDGLRGVIQNTYHALEVAKELKDKDSFCVTLNRRSGGTFVSRSKWMFDDLSVIELLEKLVAMYRQNSISGRWINDLRSESKALADPPEDSGLSAGPLTGWIIETTKICGEEILRVIKRHIVKSFSGTPALQTNELIRRIQLLNEKISYMYTSDSAPQINTSRFRDFINLMDLALYIAKGGGK